jgi:transcriptional regulator with XRE-family HTH domain
MNSKDPALVERFIELRAQGWSFARLAAELNVSKPTLINWSRLHQHRIRNLRLIEMEAVAEQLKVSRRHCLESLATDERRLREELANRDLKDIPTTRLLQLVAALRKEANKINYALNLSEPVSTDTPLAAQLPDPTLSWEA